MEGVGKSILKQGSPPHGRGKGCFVALGLAADGITPAWAGKSTGGTDAGESA